jgi:hypothetical protein
MIRPPWSRHQPGPVPYRRAPAPTASGPFAAMRSGIRYFRRSSDPADRRPCRHPGHRLTIRQARCRAFPSPPAHPSALARPLGRTCRASSLVTVRPRCTRPHRRQPRGRSPAAACARMRRRARPPVPGGIRSGNHSSDARRVAEAPAVHTSRVLAVDVGAARATRSSRPAGAHRDRTNMAPPRRYRSAAKGIIGLAMAGPMPTAAMPSSRLGGVSRCDARFHGTGHDLRRVNFIERQRDQRESEAVSRARAPPWPSPAPPRRC